MIFHKNRLLADDFHEISCFFQNLRKMPQNLSSAAVVIGASRVNHFAQIFICCTFHAIVHTLYGNCFILLCRQQIFFQNQLFRNILSGIPSQCQTDWFQTRPNILSGLIWDQSVCKSYQQTTVKEAKRLKNVSSLHLLNAL